MRWVQEAATSDVFELMNYFFRVASTKGFSEVYVYSEFVHCGLARTLPKAKLIDEKIDFSMVFCTALRAEGIVQ